LPKFWPRKALFAEKKASVDETTQILPRVVKRTHSHESGRNDGGEGVPNTRTDAAVLSARGGVASFAQKYDFKGVWHAAGKVVEQKIHACESEMKKRFPTVLGCFVDLLVLSGKLVPKIDWKNSRKITTPSYDTAERHLCQLGPDRFFGYVGNIREENWHE
jgi:hypothetical protein